MPYVFGLPAEAIHMRALINGEGMTGKLAVRCSAMTRF